MDTSKYFSKMGKTLHMAERFYGGDTYFISTVCFDPSFHCCGVTDEKVKSSFNKKKKLLTQVAELSLQNLPEKRHW